MSNQNMVMCGRIDPYPYLPNLTLTAQSSIYSIYSIYTPNKLWTHPHDLVGLRPINS